jgi:hypothetical protein
MEAEVLRPVTNPITNKNYSFLEPLIPVSPETRSVSPLYLVNPSPHLDKMVAACSSITPWMPSVEICPVLLG